jgi:hypothetical protein
MGGWPVCRGSWGVGVGRSNRLIVVHGLRPLDLWSKIQLQGLLRLISIVKIEGHGPGTPDQGPCASDIGPLVLAL